MMRTTARVLLAVMAGVLAWVGAPWLGQSPAARAETLPSNPLPASSVADTCLGQKKVWLLAVTDAGSTLRNACAGTPSSGEQALTNAGLGFTYHRSGYLCTIGGYPSSCPRTFTGQYWSYWTATPGGAWSYSNLGAGNRTPPPGTLEGWCYTKAASEAVQKSTCVGQLNSRVNPANVVPTVPQPTTNPTTAKPTTAPTTAKPTTAPTTAKPTSRPTTAKSTATSTAKAPTTTSRTTSSSTRTSNNQPTNNGSTTTARPSSSSPSQSGQPSTSASDSSTPAAGTTDSSAVTSTSPSQPDATAEPTTVPATVTESGSPTGLIVTGGVLAAGAAGVGAYVLRGRRR